MGLLNKVWSGLDFWDKEENAKQRKQFAKEDEEKKKKKQQQQKPKTVTTPTPYQPPKTVSELYKTPDTNVMTPRGVAPAPKQVYQPVKSPANDRLEMLKQQNLQRAMEETKRNTSWFDRQFTDRGWDKRAESLAMQRAATQYQEQNGYGNADAKAYIQGSKKVLDESEKNDTSQWIAPVLSAGRVGTGIAQGAAGAWDLFAPLDVLNGTLNAVRGGRSGKGVSPAMDWLNKKTDGTSRLSKSSTKKAEEQDQLAKDLGIDKAYKAGNIAGEIGSYFIPGVGFIKGSAMGAKGAKAATTVAKNVNKAATVVDQAGNANQARQIIANQMRRNLTLDEAIQELLLTGRYMGQNTARGGDTSPQSVALDLLLGLGGTLITPARRLKGQSEVAGAIEDVTNEVTGGTIATGAKALDDALKAPSASQIDTPPPPTPPIPEVAPGVKAPNLTTPPPPQAPVPTPTPQPVVVPPTKTPTPVPASGITPAPQQAQQPSPATQQQLAQAQQQVTEAATAPVVEPPAPELTQPAAPLQTPIQQLSKELAGNPVPVTPPPKPDIPAPSKASDSIESLRELRQRLLAQRQAMQDAGKSTRNIDKRLNQVDSDISTKVANDSISTRPPSKADSGREYVAPPPKNAAQSSPTKVTKVAKITENMPEEVAVKEAGDQITSYDELAQAARDAKDITSWRLHNKTTLIDANGKMKDPETGEDTTALAFFNKSREGKAPTKQKVDSKAIKPTIKKGKATIDTVNSEGKVLDSTDVTDALKKGAPKKQLVLLTSAEKELVAVGKTPDRLTEAGLTNKDVANQMKGFKSDIVPAKPKAPKTVAAPKAPKVEAPAPEVPKIPTQKELNKAARDHVMDNGRVLKSWKKQQLAKGVSQNQIDAAVEKVEGRIPNPTKGEIFTKAQKKENNRLAREAKAKAEAEGKGKRAAKNVTESLADQDAGSAGNEKLRKSIERKYAAYTKGVNIIEEHSKARAALSEISDKEMVNHVDDFLKNSDEMSDQDFLFKGLAIRERLDIMRKNKFKFDDDKLLDSMNTAIARGLAEGASRAGLMNRLTQEILQNVPSPVRVQKKLDDIAKAYEKMGVEFKPNDADKDVLIKMTDDFDTVSNQLEEAENSIDLNMAKMGKKTSAKESTELINEHRRLEAERTQFQQQAVDQSKVFNTKIKEITPPLPAKDKRTKAYLDAPDHISNYLRLAMLSAPSGRIRDAITTSINAADDAISDVLRVAIGTTSNKLFGTNLISSMGSSQSVKKGFFGGLSKLKSSWRMEPTLDEATGRTNLKGRAELNQKDSVTNFGIKHGARGWQHNYPKKLITSAVQAPTDLTVMKYTNELARLGQVDGKAKGLSGVQLKHYTEMFVDNPPKAAAEKAAQKWLKNSGMQKNFLSQQLTRAADKLDEAGSRTVYPKKHDKAGQKIPTANRVMVKSLARAFRMTTIPFVQYTGGSTHAMLVNQNPVANVVKIAKTFKTGDVQERVDELARFGWNSAKIGGLVYAMESNILETSDTDADGKTQYNGPYVVRDGEFIPMGSYGIAAGSALISAHYLKKSYEAFKNGDPLEGLANLTSGPIWAVLRASGLDNTLTGENILGGIPGNINKAANNSGKDSSGVAGTMIGGMIGDFGTQAVPAVSRDIDSVLNQQDWYNPTHEKADTASSNAVQKGINQVKASIPGFSMTLPRKSGELARDFEGRVKSANTQSEQQKAKIAASEQATATSKERTATVTSDKNLEALLSDETKAIYDKYKGDMTKASQTDRDAVWKDITATKNKLIDEKNYNSYATVLKYERAEAESKRTATDGELAKLDRKIKRAEVAAQRQTDPRIYRLYTGENDEEGGGISKDEFKKMIDKEDEAFDWETAVALWELDKAMTLANASGNTTGLDPWTKQKYSMPESKSGSGSGSGSKDKGVGTNFGTLGESSRPDLGSLTQKYKAVSGIAPLPKVSAATNLKKNISVAKGVRL